MKNETTLHALPNSHYAQDLDVRWRRKHALAGNALAMYEIAEDHLYWHKLGADGRQALSWFTKAADAGSDDACLVLAAVYRLGYLELHVLAKCESVERFSIQKDRAKASFYKRRAKILAEKKRKPDGRALYDAGAGWCRFSPDNRTSIHVSCAFTGDFPTRVLTAFRDRLDRDVPVNLYMDSEGVYDILAEGDTSGSESFWIHEDLNKRGGPKVRKLCCDMVALAKQIVTDIESDYYGWATFNYGHGFRQKESRLRRLVAALKKAIRGFDQRKN